MKSDKASDSLGEVVGEETGEEVVERLDVDETRVAEDQAQANRLRPSA